MSSTQDGLTGSAWGDWANYTDSPLRAFENELGVQAPVGFWDPAGFTADGSVENFKRRRATEIKHGRISMLATMGYITPVTWIRFSKAGALRAVLHVGAPGTTLTGAFSGVDKVCANEGPGLDAIR